MSDGMTKAAAELQALASGLDRALQRVTGGERLGFSLIIWPSHTAERCNYVSNCPRPDVVAALEALLARWKAGMPDVPGHEVN